MQIGQLIVAISGVVSLSSAAPVAVRAQNCLVVPLFLSSSAIWFRQVKPGARSRRLTWQTAAACSGK
jgi:hypothetical protein